MLLNIEHLSFSYGKKNAPVLDDLSFSVEEGSLLCLLGANGAGKSTLFKCILGILSARSGHIFIEGKNIKELSVAGLAAIFSYIPQYCSPVFSYTVRELVLMGTTPRLSLFSSPGKKERQKAEEVIEKLGLSALADRRVGAISGGERQIALLARALAQNARIILMDEPTANLDYGNQIRVLNLLQRLTRDGCTVIMSTHQPDHALLYGTNVMILEKGKIICSGVPKDVLSSRTLSDTYRTPIIRHDFSLSDTADYCICLPDLSKNQRKEGRKNGF